MKILSQNCPCCATTLPLRQTQWKIGKPFTCAACGSELVIDRNYWLPLSAIVAFWVGRSKLGVGLPLLYLFIGLCVTVLIIQQRTDKPSMVRGPQS